MDIINLDENQKFSNQDIFLTTKHILKGNEYDTFTKLHSIIYSIRYISDEKLLNSTLKLLEEINFFQNSFNSSVHIENFTFYQENEKDKLKIKASIFYVCLLRDLFKYQFNEFIKNIETPQLTFKINNRKLEHNITEITDFIKKKSFANVKTGILDLPFIKEQEIEIRKIIDSLNEIDYQHSTNTFKKEKKYLKIIKENLIEVINESNPKSKHENTFSNNGFILFEYLLNEHIRPKGKRGRFADISNYYWKMYNSEIQYIHQRPEVFKTWFYNEYDNEDIGKIKSAYDLKDLNRDKHYSNALDWFKSQNY